MNKSTYLPAGTALLVFLLYAAPGFGGSCSTNNEICRDRCYDRHDSGLYRQSCLENCDSSYEDCIWHERKINKYKAEIEQLERQNKWQERENWALCIQNCRKGYACMDGDFIDCSVCLAGC